MDGIRIADGERVIEESYGWSSDSGQSIAVLSDIHIPQDRAAKDADIILNNFLLLLDDIKEKQPDLLFITGDLGQHDGSLQAYEWIRSELALLGIPYLLIPGNHDRSDLLEQVFPSFTRVDGKLFYQVHLGCWTFIFLDSTPDYVSQEQLRWLDTVLSKSNEGAHFVVVMHHPPIRCGCRYMDHYYPLKHGEALLRVLAQSNRLEQILCGHYHTAKQIKMERGVTLHITPSSWFQINEQEEEFKISDSRIGYRWVTLNGCKFSTEVYLFEST